MQKVKYLLLSVSLILCLSTALSPLAALADTKSDLSSGVDAAGGTSGSQSAGSNLDTTITNIINLLSIVVGIVAVIMIIIAGLRFITSAGNPESAKAARNTILYAVIGLVVVALAQVIARFVLTRAT